jgi:hypothetical protein
MEEAQIEHSEYVKCAECEKPSEGKCFLHHLVFCPEHYAAHIESEHLAWPREVFDREHYTVVPVGDAGEGDVLVAIPEQTSSEVKASHPPGSHIDREVLSAEYLAGFDAGVAEERRAVIVWLEKQCETNPPCGECHHCSVANTIRLR